MIINKNKNKFKLTTIKWENRFIYLLHLTFFMCHFFRKCSMPVLLCLVHANINACFLIAFVLFKILVRETKKNKNYNNIAYRFFFSK